MQEKKYIKLLAYSAVLLSISIILGYIEAIFPINIGQVGVKVGFSNIVSIIGIKTIGSKKTFVINILRLIVLGIYFGNIVRFCISLSGFIFSYMIMIIAFNLLRFNIIVSSLLGGVFHNFGQFFILIFLLKNAKIIYLIPLYTMLGIISGLIIGIISDIVYNKIYKIRSLYE